MAKTVMQLEKVFKSYGKRVVTQVLHGIDLSLYQGQSTAIVGPSGSGKSTLLNLMGLLDRPTAGRVIVTGQDTSAMGEAELTRLRGRTIGFIFQFHHLLTAFTALENVLLPMWSDHGSCTNAMRERATLLLENVGLGSRINNLATDLSGGQQQRVAIARALAMRPQVVLADEPTGNLDTEAADQIFELLQRFSKEQNAALIVVTHDPRLAARCDRIVTVVDGKILSDVMADNTQTPNAPGPKGA